MRKRNILFICKHNLFRSKVAETYFNEINKDKTIKAKSAGIIKGNLLNKDHKNAFNLEKAIAKRFKINIKNKITGSSISLLKKQDLIILVADDVPKILFNNREYIRKVISWRIKDYDFSGEENISQVIMQIMKKVNKLNKQLEMEKLK